MSGDYLGPYRLGPNDENQGIYTGDARELARAIPDESVDLIFTDPPYPKEFIPLYGWLAKEAARTLKDGRRCMALAGHVHLPTIIADMQQHLTWAWIIAQIQGNLTSAIFPERVWASWKPCLVYRKGKIDRRANFAMDCFRDTAAALEYSKKFHTWGQGAPFFAYYIDRWTNPGDVILDPFCGGGTLAAVCMALGRRWLAFEIDPGTAADARRRVQMTQPPLFVMQEEQLGMEL